MDHDALVERLYAAAAGQEDWNSIPLAICTSFAGASMLFADGYADDPKSFHIVENNFGADVMEQAGFSMADNFRAETNPAISALASAPLGKSMIGRPIWERATAAQMAFFENCFVRNNIPFTQTFAVIRDGGAIAGGFLARSRSRGPMDRHEIKRFDAVLSHLRRATQIRQRLGLGRARQDGLARLVDQAGLGFILLDRSLVILYQNAVADEMLMRGDVFSAGGGRFRLNDPAAQKVLLRRLRSLYATSAVKIEGPIAARRTPDRAQIPVTVNPATGAAGPLGAFTAYAAIIVGDPREEARLPTARSLEASFGLTPAEAQVARLTPLALPRRAIAERLGIADSTVKTHLGNARAKVGVTSTAALALLVGRLGLATPGLCEQRSRAR
jgi:DNA-binding CsgD family transcriptional regulator